MRCSTLLCILTGVLAYLVMGALVFHHLEASEEKTNSSDFLEKFLDNYTCVSPDVLQALIEVQETKQAVIPIEYKNVDLNE